MAGGDFEDGVADVEEAEDGGEECGEFAEGDHPQKQ